MRKRTSPWQDSLPSDSSETLSHLDGLTPARLTRLLLRCGEGDIDAFDTYYRLTSPVLATLVAARRPTPATADAVLVEVYVTIWRDAHTFPDSGCSVWQWTLSILLDALGQSTRPEPGTRAVITGGDS